MSAFVGNSSKYIVPEFGATYTLRNGGEYRCLFVSDADKVEQGGCSAVLVRVSDSWELIAHGVQQNENGTIEWDYSTGGHWPPPKSRDVRFEIWQDSELGEKPVKSFNDRLVAAAWINENERFYPGWHLRIVERKII